MSRSTYDVKDTYVGAGNQSAYTFDFKIEVAAQLLIIEVDDSNVETQRVLGTDVTYLSSVVFDAVAGGGTVNLAANLTTNYTLIILLANDLPTQSYEFRNKTSFTLRRFENALDLIAGAVQRLSYRAKQAFRIHDLDDETTLDMQFPPGFSSAADKVLKVNSAGDGVEYGPDSGDIADAQTNAAAAAASAAAAAVSETNAATSETNAAASAAAAAAIVTVHAALTTTHGVTGNIVGTGGTQTLATKTLTAPIFDGFGVFNHISTPATPAASKLSLYSKSDNLMYTKNPAGVEIALVNLTAAQILSGKDFAGGTASNTSRVTIPSATKATLNGLTRKAGTFVYATDDEFFYFDDGTNLIKMGADAGAQSLHLRAFAGNGSGDIKIPYFTNVDINTGSDFFTATNSSTTGVSITALKDCNIIGIYMNRSSSSGASLGWSVDATAAERDTNIESIAATKIGMLIYSHTANFYSHVVITRKLLSGEVLSPHNGGVTYTGSTRGQLIVIATGI